MDKIARHYSLKTIALFNLVVFLMFFASLYTLVAYSEGDARGMGTVVYVYMLVGFLSFTSYFYYEFLNLLGHRGGRSFTKAVFIVNILAPLLFIVFLLSQATRM